VQVYWVDPALTLTCVGDASRLVSTGEAARAIGVSRRTLTRYVTDGLLTPDMTLPSGRHRWDVERLREQMRELARRQREPRD
jgi:DNA-binding transcriptional MerR regulator